MGSSKVEKWSPKAVEALRNARLVSGFINGDNDSTWGDRRSAEEAVMMTLAYVRPFLDNDVYYALLTGLGLKEVRNPFGQLCITRDNDPFPRSEP